MARRRSQFDWFDVLDLERALKNVEIDLRGDWYRDPWSWPEIRWALNMDRDVFRARLNNNGVRGAVAIDVPKENFGSRPAIVMDPIDRTIYQALTDRISVDLIGAQPEWVYGWRLPPREPDAGSYARNDFQWDSFTTSLNRLAGTFDYALKTDVVSFFATIDLNVMADALHDRAGGGAPQDRLLDMLDGWDRVPGRGGLPQRSFGSAVLANAYLKPVDDLLRHYGAVPGWWKLWAPSGAACRWMDDIWLFGDDAGKLRRAQVDLQSTLRSIGLDINLAKTDLLERDDLIREARQIEHSAVDKGLTTHPEDATPLNELIDRLLDRPEHASRTSVRFVTTRMRSHTQFSRLDSLIAVAHRMPHAADHLARLFRDAGAWRDLDGWFLDYSKGQWAVFQWSIAQFGTMFPSDQPQDTVKEYLAEVLASGSSSLLLAAVAAERLASWSHDAARVAIREASRRAADPLIRRTLALSAVMAKEERRLVRDLLGEFEENSTTLAMLEATKFRSPKPTPDF